MKKAFTACVLLAAAGGALAQSSVTMYGVLDIGFAHDTGSNPAGTVNALDYAGSTYVPTRLGFKGQEDLGNGLSAIFTAEMGFGVDTGAFDGTGIGFGRQAFVGLQGRFGAVKLGRQYNPLFLVGAPYDPFNGGMAGAYTRFMSLGPGKRLNNAVVYTSPTLAGGFNAEAAYSLGEVAGDSARARAAGLSLNYANGPLSVGLGYNDWNSNPAPALPVVHTNNTLLGAAWDFGVVRLSGIYQVNKDNAATRLDARDWLVGAKAPFGAWAFFGSYMRHTNRALAHADSRQVALGATYNLSRRTALYSSYSRTHNDALASLQTPGTPGGADRLVGIGINHMF
ncbi:MAG: porin [Pseudomonadota bacterium]